MHPRDRAGQATAEYAALLTARRRRTCRRRRAGRAPHDRRSGRRRPSAPASASSVATCAARPTPRPPGLAPCTVGERALGNGLVLTIGSIRFGSRREWTAAMRSDGSVLVTKARRRSGGGLVGHGRGGEPARARVRRSGQARLRDRHRAGVGVPGRRLRRALHDEQRRGLGSRRRGGSARRPGTERGRAGEGRRHHAHRRRGNGRGRRRRSHRPRAHDALHPCAAGLERQGLAPRRRRERERARRARRIDGDHERRAMAARDRLPYRPARTAARPGDRVGGRLDLRDPANRAAAEPLLARRLPWPPGVLRGPPRGRCCAPRRWARRARRVCGPRRLRELRLSASTSASRSASTTTRSTSRSGLWRPAPGRRARKSGCAKTA